MWGRPQRDSYEHRLKPQDADTERSHRRRHKSKDRRKDSPDRVYRSDDEPRRRHRHDEDRDRHRGHSSHRQKRGNHRRQDSTSEPDEDTGGVRVSERSHRMPYGEHRHSPSPPPSSSPILYGVDRPLPKYIDYYTPGRSDKDDTRTESPSPPLNTNRVEAKQVKRVHRVALPSNAQSPAFRLRDRSPQGTAGSRAPTPGHHEDFGGDSQPPRISVSPYPTDHSQTLSDIIFPGDPNLAPGIDMQRHMSSSGASTATWRYPPPSPTLSSVGTLGSRMYQYQSLRPSEIRLVRVLPERMWKLKCEMLHVSLHEVPEYVAISVSRSRRLETHANIKLE